ncbi:MAG: glycosyltransferase [bacterium]
MVYVTQGYPPERVGGVEVYLKGLVHELQKDHEVFVFSRGLADYPAGKVYESDDRGSRITRLSVDLRDIEGFRDIYMRPWIDELFEDYLKEVRPDVVHVQHLGGLSLGMVRTAADNGFPLVMTLSDHQPYCPRGQRIRNDKRVCKQINLDECLECLMPQTAGLSGKAAKLSAYLLGKSRGIELLKTMHQEIADNFSCVHTFIMPSEFHRTKMVEAGVPEENSCVIPYGLDLSQLDRVPPRPPNAPVRRFAYLGTLIPSKGVEDLISAFKRMKTPDCSLHIYGEAVPYHGITDYDKRLVEMARSADISFYGPYQPDELPRVLERIDAVVMPSKWYESYGITIREAFRARRPVIVSDMGAFSEAVEHGGNGLKFQPGDVFELAEVMDKLAGNPELAGNIASVGGPVLSIPEHASKVLEIYREAKVS